MCLPVCPHVSVVAGACVTGCACMSSAAVARSVSDCPQPLRFVAVSLSAALSAAVSLTAVSSLASLGLPISVLCVTVSVPLCVTIHPGVAVCFTHHPGHRWACRAHWCPELRPSPSHPRPAVGQAGRLFAMPAPGKHQDPERKGHLPHLRSLPLSLPWTGLAQSPVGGAPKLEMCPDPSPTHGPPAFPSPQPWPCLPACFSLSLPGYLLASPLLSAPTSSHLCFSVVHSLE